MATKKTTEQTAPATPPAKSDPNGYQIKAEEWGFTRGDTDSQVMAALSTRSALTATTYKAFVGGGDSLEVTDLMGELRKAGEEVAGGDMSRVEKMLAHQALTLDAIFNNLAQRSHKQETFKGLEVFMRLALKAQAQARSTAEALAEIKNPRPVQFVKQANISTGPQQVNNGVASRTGTFENEQNKLLTGNHHGNMDTRAQGTAGRVNQTVEAVGAVNRACDT